MSKIESDNEQSEVKNETNSNKIWISKIKKIVKHSIGLAVGLALGFIFAVFITHSIYNENVQLKETISTKEATIKEQEEKIAQAQPWFDMNNEEQIKIDKENEIKRNERLANEQKAREEKIAADNKKQEEIRIAKENEEKKGYDTGIGYKDLARNPKDYVGKKIKFEGKVIQVMEGDSETQLRLAVNGDYDNVILCAYNKSLVSSRILEDDYITVRGLSNDVVSYESTMGGNITIPSMLVKKIDMK